jgi:hypothetical protein
MTGRTPDWLVERLHAGDLPAAEAEAVRRRLEAEGGLSRLEDLARDDAAFRVSHPAAAGAEVIRRRAGRTGRSRRWRFFVVPALAAVAAGALVVMVPLVRPGGSLRDADDTREKGQVPRLEIYRRSQPVPLADGAAARAGDLLQLAYVSAGAPYGVIVSVDGRGAVTLHCPEGGGPAARLTRGRAVPLSHAYQLDDAPRFERFFLVTGSQPFDSAAVVAAARSLAAGGDAERGALALPQGLAQRALTLRKP